MKNVETGPCYLCQDSPELICSNCARPICQDCIGDGEYTEIEDTRVCNECAFADCDEIVVQNEDDIQKIVNIAKNAQELGE